MEREQRNEGSIYAKPWLATCLTAMALCGCGFDRAFEETQKGILSGGGSGTSANAASQPGDMFQPSRFAFDLTTDTYGSCAELQKTCAGSC